MAFLAGAYVTLDDLATLSDRLPRSRGKRRGLKKHGGPRMSRLKGRGVDFDEVRLYQPGDDVRNIDWKVTARKGRAHTKVFREERERPTLVVVDQTQSMFFGSRRRLKSVAAAEAAARIAFRTQHSGDRVGGVVFGTEGVTVVEPRLTGHNVAEFLGAIAAANQALAAESSSETVGQAVADAFEQVRRVTRFNYRIVVISDFTGFGEQARSDIFSLSRHNRLQLVFVYDELERRLPPASLYSVTDGVSRLRFDSSLRKSRDHYRDRFGTRLKLLADESSALQVEFYEYSTESEMDPGLLDV